MPRLSCDTERKKNQFGKEERHHLLGIMKRYAPLLDKNASTVVRKEIWTAIEEEFREAGFTGKTSAQLKKYWQNYKYHCKKAKLSGKDNEASPNSQAICKDVNIGGIAETAEWNRHRIIVENRFTTRLSEGSATLCQSLEDSRRTESESVRRFAEIYENNGRPFRKLNLAATSDCSIDLTRIKMESGDDELTVDEVDIVKREISSPESRNFSGDDSKEGRTSGNEDEGEPMMFAVADRKTRNHVVVSNAEISNNSVTVSVIYPQNENSVSTTKVELRRKIDGNEPAGNASGSSADNAISVIEDNSNDRRHDKPAEQPETEDRFSLGNDRNGDKVRTITANLEIENESSLPRFEYQTKLKHRLLLHQLEAEEKRLKVKIAEMAIQEIQLRIRALKEDMRRTEELYQLNLALALPRNIQLPTKAPRSSTSTTGR